MKTFRHHSHGIFEWWINVFKHEIHIRIEPDEFKKTVSMIGNLIDDEKYTEAKRALEEAYSRWGDQPDLIRLDSFRQFEEETFDDVEHSD